MHCLQTKVVRRLGMGVSWRNQHVPGICKQTSMKINCIRWILRWIHNVDDLYFFHILIFITNIYRYTFKSLIIVVYRKEPESATNDDENTSWLWTSVDLFIAVAVILFLISLITLIYCVRKSKYKYKSVFLSITEVGFIRTWPQTFMYAKCKGIRILQMEQHFSSGK